MCKPTARLRIGRDLGAWLAVLAVSAGNCGLATASHLQPPPDLPQATLEERLRRVEEVNARLLEQLKSDREESARRYGELEDRYRELQRRLGEPRPAAEAETSPATGETTTRSSHLGRPGEVGRPHPTRDSH